MEKRRAEDCTKEIEAERGTEERCGAERASGLKKLITEMKCGEKEKKGSKSVKNK